MLIQGVVCDGEDCRATYTFPGASLALYRRRYLAADGWTERKSKEGQRRRRQWLVHYCPRCSEKGGE